eukprot:scaffold16643_cov84-Isochrysis_galbana.AAC.1
MYSPHTHAQIPIHSPPSTHLEAEHLAKDGELLAAKRVVALDVAGKDGRQNEDEDVAKDDEQREAKLGGGGTGEGVKLSPTEEMAGGWMKKSQTGGREEWAGGIAGVCVEGRVS